jgi:PTS system mannose-specific IIB component
MMSKPLLELRDMGIEVEIRKLANEPKGDLMAALKAKGMA